MAIGLTDFWADQDHIVYSLHESIISLEDMGAAVANARRPGVLAASIASAARIIKSAARCRARANKQNLSTQAP